MTDHRQVTFDRTGRLIDDAIARGEEAGRRQVLERRVDRLSRQFESLESRRLASEIAPLVDAAVKAGVLTEAQFEPTTRAYQVAPGPTRAMLERLVPDRRLYGEPVDEETERRFETTFKAMFGREVDQ